MFDLILPIVDRAKRMGVQFADVRAVSAMGHSIVVQDSKAEKLFASDSGGLAVRVLVDGAWGFASCEGFSPKLLADGFEQALALAKHSASHVSDPGTVAEFVGVQGEALWLGEKALDEVSLEDKQRACLTFEKQALAAGEGKIVNSIVRYSDGLRRMWVANTRGTQVHTSLVRTHVMCQVTAVENDLRQQNYQAVGRQCGPELLATIEPEHFSLKAAKKVLQQLRSKKAPAGEFPVIFHPTISGLLAHEALGHNSEADAVRTGQSVLQGKMGQKVASDLVTICDDATIAGCYGSEPFDSEGTPTRKRTIITNGVLTEFLYDLENAGHFGVQPNGCGRAQDHTCVPLVRMSNTFFAPGESTFAEMLVGIDRGIYLKEGLEGYVHPERGQFLCHANEAWMIENGQLGEPLRDVSVSGLLSEALMDIDKVGSDFMMVFPGTCGKGGQGVPTDCGGPHLRVSKLVVGGECEE
jgi:TldD protein